MDSETKARLAELKELIQKENAMQRPWRTGVVGMVAYGSRSEQFTPDAAHNAEPGHH